VINKIWVQPRKGLKVRDITRSRKTYFVEGPQEVVKTDYINRRLLAQDLEEVKKPAPAKKKEG